VRPSIEMNSLMKLRWMSYGSCWRRSCDEEWDDGFLSLFGFLAFWLFGDFDFSLLFVFS